MLLYSERFSRRSVTRPGSFGDQLVTQLLAGGYRGAVHLVNPRYREVAGRPCLPSLADLPGPVALAVLAVANAALEAQLTAAAAGRRVSTAAPTTEAAPTTVEPATSAPPTTEVPTTTTKPKPAAPAKLRSGSEGAQVKALQRRLHELGAEAPAVEHLAQQQRRRALPRRAGHERRVARVHAHERPRERHGVGDQFRIHYDPSHAILMGQDTRSIFQYLKDEGYHFLIGGFHVKGQVIDARGVAASLARTASRDDGRRRLPARVSSATGLTPKSKEKVRTE